MGNEGWEMKGAVAVKVNGKGFYSSRAPADGRLEIPRFET